MADTRPLRLFISYSHRDESYRQDLETYLKPLKVHGILEWWDDRKIGAGQEWEKSIHGKLDEAEIILLLISPDFLASDYCRDKEVKRAMERHEAGEACVIPVILRTCRWQWEVFGKLQGVPREGKPIARWEDRDDAFLNVVEAIEAALESLRARGTDRQDSSQAKDQPAAIERIPLPESKWPDFGFVAAIKATAESLYADGTDRPGSSQAKHQPAGIESIPLSESEWPDFHIFRDRLEGGRLGPEMVVLPAGEFLMGSPDSDEEAYDDEKP